MSSLVLGSTWTFSCGGVGGAESGLENGRVEVMHFHLCRGGQVQRDLAFWFLVLPVGNGLSPPPCSPAF